MPEHATKPASKPGDTPTPPPPQQTPKPKEDDKVSGALEAFARADATSVQAAASAYKMRTDKVENKQLAGTEERGITASGTHESAVQATAYAKAEIVELADAIAVLVDAGVIVGASIKLSGELEAKYGKLTAKLGANLTLFAGAFAKVSGRAQFGASGVELQGNASAFAGAKGKASIETSVDIGALGLGAEVEAEGKAGAWGEAEGEISFSKDSIAVNGSVKAFAGVEGEVTGTGKARLYGRDAFTIKAGVTGSLGAGGELGGGFSIKGGKIQLHLDAKGAVGIGGGGDVDMAIDLKPVAVWAWRQADKAKWALRTDGKGADMLDHPTKIVEPLTSKVSKYSQAKIDALHLKKAENFVKLEKLQAYVGEVMPRKQVKGRPNASEIDACIKQAIEAALRKTTAVQTIEVTVADGKIMKLDNLPEPDQITEKFAVKSKTGKALTSIVATE